MNTPTHWTVFSATPDGQGGWQVIGTPWSPAPNHDKAITFARLGPNVSMADADARAARYQRDYDRIRGIGLAAVSA